MEAPEQHTVFQMRANFSVIHWHNYIFCFVLFSFPNSSKYWHFWTAAMHWVGVFMELSVIIPNFPFWVVTFSSELITLFIKPRTLLPTYIISHLSTLNFLCHFVTQSLSLTRPIYSSGHSALILHWLNLYPQQTFHLTANTFLQIIFEFVKRNQSLAEFHLGLFSVMPLCSHGWRSGRGRGYGAGDQGIQHWSVYRVLQRCVPMYLRLDV